MKAGRALLVCLLTAMAWLPAVADDPAANAIIAAMDARLWSDTSQGKYTMTIQTPHWERTLELDVWMDRPRATFVRVLSPAKERGIGSLRIDTEMWNYIPRIDRIVKIPPSMMLQPWMGSDLSNDDLVKASSLVTDYIHRTEEIEDGIAHIVSHPREEATVVWGRIESWIEAGTGIPHRQLYFDEQGKTVREMTFTDVAEMDGRTLPTRWVVQPLPAEGQKTVLTIESVQFDEPIDPAVFSERNLRNPDR